MNKRILISTALCLLMLVGFNSFGASNYWHYFGSATPPSRHALGVDAKAYEVLTLDQQQMRSFLFNLSTQFEESAPIILPTPNHQFQHFHIWKTPAMEQALADKYPDIQTFTAVSDENPAITAKLEYTLLGFSALIYNGDDSYFIQGYNKDADGYYIAYYMRDLKSNAAAMPCLAKTLEDEQFAQGQLTTINTNGSNTAARLNGSVRHTYRFALSCTGEYAHLVFTNPTKPLVLSEMVASTNHINGYYEREFAISMMLVANNDAIIYTDTATDPYTCNLNCDCLIGQANDHVKAVIGVSNFDIGFTMCTAGGGLGVLGALCNASGKAAGVGYSSGANDIAVLLHEMGHQFGAGHTFNANTGGCYNNADSATAYEPGAGISTMSYSGGCDPNSVGVKDQPYYHVFSLMQVADHIAGQTSCGITSAGASAIVVPPMNDTFRIPKNTPFELTAPIIAHGANVGILYNWEQFDLGNFASTESQNAMALTGPLFRSYDPTESPIRPYPSYANIMADTYGEGLNGAGQRISKKERNISFKLTVRSIYQGWGNYAINDRNVIIRTAKTATDFRIHQPDVDAVWNPGDHKVITWDVAGSNGDTVKCNWVNIYFSEDDGATFPYLLVANAPNTGSYTVTAPNIHTTQGRIKIKAVGSIFFDIAKGRLTVTGTGGTAIKEVGSALNVLIYPNPASNMLYLENALKAKPVQVVIYSSLGQQVWKGTLKDKIALPVHAFARGVYWVDVIDDNTGERNTQRIVLQ